MGLQQRTHDNKSDAQASVSLNCSRPFESLHLHVHRGLANRVWLMESRSRAALKPGSPDLSVRRLRELGLCSISIEGCRRAPSVNKDFS